MLRSSRRNAGASTLPLDRVGVWSEVGPNRYAEYKTTSLAIIIFVVSTSHRPTDIIKASGRLSRPTHEAAKKNGCRHRLQLKLHGSRGSAYLPLIHIRTEQSLLVTYRILGFRTTRMHQAFPRICIHANNQTYNVISKASVCLSVCNWQTRRHI